MEALEKTVTILGKVVGSYRDSNRVAPEKKPDNLQYGTVVKCL